MENFPVGDVVPKGCLSGWIVCKFVGIGDGFVDDMMNTFVEVVIIGPGSNAPIVDVYCGSFLGI